VDQIDTGDIESAERLAHTAKNVNGNIGASELENLAGEIEHLLRENTSLEMIGPKIDHFKNKQQSLIADLRAAISTIKKSEPIKDGEQSTEVIIKQLKDFLLDDDSAALTYFEENSTRISRSFSIKVFSNTPKNIYRAGINNKLPELIIKLCIKYSNGSIIMK